MAHIALENSSESKPIRPSDTKATDSRDRHHSCFISPYFVLPICLNIVVVTLAYFWYHGSVIIVSLLQRRRRGVLGPDINSSVLGNITKLLIAGVVVYYLPQRRAEERDRFKRETIEFAERQADRRAQREKPQAIANAGKDTTKAAQTKNTPQKTGSATTCKK